MEKVDNFAINWKEMSTTELKNWVKKFNDKVEELNDLIVERDDEEIDIPRNWKEYYERFINIFKFINGKTMSGGYKKLNEHNNEYYRKYLKYKTKYLRFSRKLKKN